MLWYGRRDGSEDGGRRSEGVPFLFHSFLFNLYLEFQESCADGGGFSTVETSGVCENDRHGDLRRCRADRYVDM